MDKSRLFTFTTLHRPVHGCRSMPEIDARLFSLTNHFNILPAIFNSLHKKSLAKSSLRVKTPWPMWSCEGD